MNLRIFLLARSSFPEKIGCESLVRSWQNYGEGGGGWSREREETCLIRFILRLPPPPPPPTQQAFKASFLAFLPPFPCKIALALPAPSFPGRVQSLCEGNSQFLTSLASSTSLGRVSDTNLGQTVGTVETERKGESEAARAPTKM